MPADPASPKSFSFLRLIILFVVVAGLIVGFLAWRVWKAAPASGSMLDQIARKDYRAYAAVVDGKHGWQIFADAVVKPGERVVIRATGSWKVGPTHPMIGPLGMEGAKPGLVDWRLSDKGNLGQLLGGVGTKPELVYSLKDEATFVAPAAGPLSFTINDSDPSNNDGSMALSIEVYDQ